MMIPLDKLRNFLGINKRPKVFCIGYNKTGTTTVESVLKSLGYSMPKQKDQEMTVVEELHLGNYKPLRALCSKYDAFQDMPFSQGVTYAVLDVMFPGSKFILTTRDSNEWFESLKRFHLKGVLKRAGINKVEDFGEATFKDKKIYLHQNYLHNIAKRHAAKLVDCELHYDWSLVYNEEYRIALYEQRNQEVIKFFQDRRDQLLVLNLANEVDNSKIIEFLDLPGKLVAQLPCLNKSQ